MGKQPFISHVVNGYSRYDVPESKAFTMTPGILYPVRIDFINARDRVTIEQGIDVRSNPLAVPSFNPYTVRLHRFWVPMQLYHPEMRTNSSKFDMNNVSLNWLPVVSPENLSFGKTPTAYSNSLFFWLRSINRPRVSNLTSTQAASNDLVSSALPSAWFNADTYLAYWDIVRNYYSYSQWGVYSFAWPTNWSLYWASATEDVYSISYVGSANISLFKQKFGNLEFLDAYYESRFYPSAVSSVNNTFNRADLFYQIVRSDFDSANSGDSDGYPVAPISSGYTNAPDSQFSTSSGSNTAGYLHFFNIAHPMAVVPSNPDRFSRLLPNGSSDAVSMTGVATIPQLAIASRLQEYKDLLGAGGSRYSDWLETFFASKIAHVDRPKLLFSASQTINVQVVMNQGGFSMFDDAGSTQTPLGQQGGSIAFNDRLGRSQSYYFDEPGYLIDMLSVRPVYYWAGIRPDYLNYRGSDYFNPIYNDIGYQDVSGVNFGIDPTSAVSSEPCFNEFRSSYDEVLGQISVYATLSDSRPLYAYWLQQRDPSVFTKNGISGYSYSYVPALFVDMSQVNSPFASNVEDNFFVNMSYAVRKKNLVNKTFATRLSNR
ncbi:major capsid protein [Dipodfec virus UA23Rod_963]|uniref:Major capsid protein n=1 Tax=Dipodfec virus UA23Rod_963 TaxID=2929335 RepID=A0A976N1Z0_9VIRU|nr:major capsid protein [Dipodfec virus UA23Rod_963]